MSDPFSMASIAAVSSGAIVGALTRHSINVISAKKGFTPWSTAVINITGSFILGALVCKIMIVYIYLFIVYLCIFDCFWYTIH